MTLSGKNVWQETEETHQEEMKINQAEKLHEMPQKTTSWKMFENKLKNFSFTFTMFTWFVCKKLTEENCEVLVFSIQFPNVLKKNLYPCLFLSCRMFVAGPSNLS